MPRDRTYRAVIRALRVVFAVLGLRIDLRGGEHLPTTGGAVVAANHVGYLDFALVGLVGAERGRLVRFLAKSGVFESPLSRGLMRAMRHVPVDRGQGAGALRAATRLAAAGEVVGVFSEGTISRAWLVKPLAPGAAAMAIAAGVPLVPVVTFGGHRLITVDRKGRLRRRTPVSIRVGAPLRPDPGEDARALTERLRGRLAELLDEAIADYPRAGHDAAWWLPQSWGGSAPGPEEAARLDADGLARLAARRSRRSTSGSASPPTPAPMPAPMPAPASAVRRRLAPAGSSGKAARMAADDKRDDTTDGMPLGIDFGGSGIKGAAVDLERGDFAGERVKIKTPKKSTPDAVADVVSELIEQLMERHPDATGPVGVTVPGVVQHGIVRSAANIHKSWIDVDADAVFTRASGRDVHVMNDADAAGLAEARYGAARETVRGLVILTTLGTGIGSAFIHDGVLVPNSELGHLEIDGFVAEKRAASSVFEAEGLTYEEWAGRLTVYYRTVEKLFTPDLIVVGGGVSRDADKFLHLIDIRTPIVAAELQNRAGIIGAALVAEGRLGS